ncbi:MAG: histone deacetylase [Proteobacteria bacterium]|nr:histone deacetylase [Pseudomonadota bacterium]
MQVGILYDPCFLDHECNTYDHPERPERLPAVIRGLKSAGVWEGAAQITARPASLAELYRAHTEDYVSTVLKVLEQGDFGNLDLDTFYSPGSLKAALNAAGGGVDLARAVHIREIDWGIAVVRPPGHHATWNRPMGFCIFNNIAVAARSLTSSGDAERVVIIDWDVHHGNGTQDQFWDDPNVLYFSIHQWPFYPGSGQLGELGGPEALGKTINFPMPSGAVDADYLMAMDEVILPIIEAFSPNHIMVSAGFDAHIKDPLANVRLSSACFSEMAVRLKNAADHFCQGRLTVFLEGGYSLEALEDATSAMANGFCKKTQLTTPDQLDTKPTHPKTISNTKNTLKKFWPNIFSI